jgi:protoporphyrinogen oxidase
MIIILGAGVAGISAAYHLGLNGKKSIVFEKENTWGGLVDNFELNGFRFDKAIHLSFTKNKYVQEILEKSSNFYLYTPKISNYCDGTWIKHPVQNNLYSLKLMEKIKILKGFIRRRKCEGHNIRNYEEWLKYHYGDYFTKKFPMRYTRKYWRVEAKELTIDWIGSRMYKSTIKEVLNGCIHKVTPYTYYGGEMRYPKKGGYKSFFEDMAKKCNIKYNKEVFSVDPIKKNIYFKDGTLKKYKVLISSLPLPELIKMIQGVPEDIRTSAEKLSWTSIALVSLGFNKPNIPKNMWFYIYDEDFLPSRVYSPSLKSADNVPPGCSSLQFEIYFTKHEENKKTKEELIKHVVNKFKKMHLFKEEDIIIKDCRIIEYGNVIFDHNLNENRKTVQRYLDTLGIHYIGRFGKWDYLWSDQSLLTGKKVAEKLV